MANISKEVEGKAPEEVGMPVDVVLPIFLFKPPISFVFFSFSFFLFSFFFFSFLTSMFVSFKGEKILEGVLGS